MGGNGFENLGPCSRENGVKISKKNANRPKITFRGPILVPKVSFWGFWGLVCIEKWSQNFDSDTRSAISSTPKMAKMTPFWSFWGYQKWRFGCPNQNSETTFQYKLAPKTPKKTPQEPKSDLKKSFLAILRFLNIFTSFSLEHGPFFSTLNPTTLNSFLDFQTFSRSFICINTVKKISSVTFLAFWRLGPRPIVDGNFPQDPLPPPRLNWPP